eukprot:m.453905 g.453905  ORF g.453905 m.453905 type:complete len:343 (+) comp20570_c0_seq1:58-1086(+)
MLRHKRVPQPLLLHVVSRAASMDQPQTKSAKKNAARAAKRRAAREALQAQADAAHPAGVGAAEPPVPEAAAAAAPDQLPALVDIGINIGSRDMKDWRAMVTRAAEAGVGTVLLTGVDIKSIRQNIAAIAQYRGPARLHSTAGIHPHHSKGGITPALLDELREHLAHPAVVAVGECGLDFNRKLSPHADQIAVFDAQVGLAIELNKPMFCHEREAASATLNVLDHYRGQLPPVVIHCFTGSAADAHAYLERGFYLGFTGTVCKFERGKHLRKLLVDVPIDRILLETDAPYMGFVKGRRNSEPADTVGVAQKVAEVKGLAYETVCRITTATAARVFGLTDDGTR